MKGRGDSNLDQGGVGRKKRESMIVLNRGDNAATNEETLNIVQTVDSINEKKPFLQNKNSENAKKVVITQTSKDEHERHQYYSKSYEK